MEKKEQPPPCVMDTTSTNGTSTANDCADNDDGKDIAMETVEVLIMAAVTEQVDDNCSERDSRSTPTKTDKSSSDSGVSVNNKEHSTSNKLDTNPETDSMTTMEEDNCTDKNQASSLICDSVLALSSETETKSDDSLEMEASKESTDKSLAEEAEKTNSVAMEEDSLVESSISSNKAKIPTWPRHTRRGARNYRHSTQDDGDEEAETEQNSSTVNGTVEEQIPLLAETAAQAEEGAASSATDSSMPSQNENSSASSSNIANRLTSFLNDGFISDDDDDDDDDEDDDDDDIGEDIDEDEDDDDDDDETDDEDDHDVANNTEHANALADVMNKPKPQYSWSLTQELMRREHGLSGDGRRSMGSGMSPGFNARYYAARHVIERMKISHCLLKHSGCVNCLNFNRSGNLLCSGSDDTRIIVWNWAQRNTKCVIKSGHTENIFQTKFVNSVGVLDIVSAGRDGQVRRSILPSSGGKPQSSLLYRHKGSVHKLLMSPNNPFEIISAGEDAHIRRKDLRTDDNATSICKVGSSKNNRKVRLFSISHHPYAPEICVCGCDNYVRIYDKRSMSKPVHMMCPEHLIKASIDKVTCAVYNSTGSEVLASYSEDYIYLFNNREYKPGSYLHRYGGHYNYKTIKGVNFFGPNSEYVISGSDCGNIFFWDKNTEAIINFMPGDTMGVVNCLEPHPMIPVLATSGLDSSIKIWTPNSDVYPPDLSKLEACVKRNLRRSVFYEDRGFNDREFNYFIRQFLRRPPPRLTFLTNDDSGEQHSSSSSSVTDSDPFDCPQMDGIQCNTQ